MSTAIDKPQYRALLKALAVLRDEPYSLMIELIARTGCRTEEAMNVRLEHLDERGGFIRIPGAKGSNDRSVPLDKKFMAVLAQKLICAENTVESFFGGLARRSIKRQVQRKWVDLRIECLGLGFDDVGLHGLRATYAQLIYKGNHNDILLTKELLGHRRIESTMCYVRMLQAEERRPEILKSLR